MTPLEFLIGLWILGLSATALGCIVAYILDFRRDPPPWWVRRQIPDEYDPTDWQPKAQQGRRNP